MRTQIVPEQGFDCIAAVCAYGEVYRIDPTGIARIDVDLNDALDPGLMKPGLRNLM